jgi:HD-GYP domain-containing protein (c-di-GMP phosphodiesterase class II)
MHILTEMMTARNPGLLEHGQRTARYAAALGCAIGVSSGTLIDLHYAAVLHDIGQAMLPIEIVQKDGPLTHEEYAVLQCHPRDGARLLETIPVLRRAAILIAHHHEHWDGSGYPYGLRDTFIPLGSRILAVADRFDALCSDKGNPQRLAMKLLRRLAGSQLDPTLVGVFVQRMENESSDARFAGMSGGGFGARVPLAPTG